MKTIFRSGIWKILKLFYDSKNSPLYLREISRKSKLNESTVSRHLNNLLREGVLKFSREANLKKFYLPKSRILNIFPLFDSEKMESLPILRRDAINLYIKKLEHKPLLLVVFGSTAKGTYKKNSDIDILAVFSGKYEDNEAVSYADSQTGIRMQAFKIKEDKFKEELLLKKDKVVQSALETGFPVFNEKYFYEVRYNE